jgi:hypothetical protein
MELFGTSVADIALDSTPLGHFIDIENLVDLAEASFTGERRGIDKEAWILSVVLPLLTELDNNDQVEFGVKDWDELMNGVKLSIQAAVKIRNATTWFDKKSS